MDSLTPDQIHSQNLYLMGEASKDRRHNERMEIERQKLKVLEGILAALKMDK